MLPASAGSTVELEPGGTRIVLGRSRSRPQRSAAARDVRAQRAPERAVHCIGTAACRLRRHGDSGRTRNLSHDREGRGANAGSNGIAA
jgi:hypothetical protein